jgi:hypothetical protein
VTAEAIRHANAVTRPRTLAAHEVLADYPAIGLPDAMNVVLAREFRTDVIATLDRRHFRMLRPMTKHDAFRLLPDDIPETESRQTLGVTEVNLGRVARGGQRTSEGWRGR